MKNKPFLAIAFAILAACSSCGNDGPSVPSTPSEPTNLMCRYLLI